MQKTGQIISNTVKESTSKKQHLEDMIFRACEKLAV